MKKSMKEKNLKFVKTIHELLKLKINFDDYKLNTLKNKLESMKELSNYNWIRKKINEL